MNKQQQVVLKQYPTGVPTNDDFELVESAQPRPQTGQLLCRNLILSLDPYIRGVISGRQIYAERTQPGDVIAGSTLAEVVETNASGFAVGDRVVINGGWQQFAVVNADAARKFTLIDVPPSTALGVLGMPGLTAWAGMLDMAQPQPGDTAVVSAASGPVGSTACQLAKRAGAKVIGIAGGEQKCGFVTRELGMDHCVDYKSQKLVSALQHACPDGIDVYFDNVGGDTLAAVLANLALHARITLCGLITQYNAAEPPPGPNLGPVIGARAIMRGLVVYDYFDRFDAFHAELAPLVRSGELKFQEDWSEGLEHAAAAFVRLMHGKNFGKTLVRIDH